MLGQWEEAIKDLQLALQLDYGEKLSAVLKKIKPNAKIERERRRRAKAQAKKQEQSSDSSSVEGQKGCLVGFLGVCHCQVVPMVGSMTGWVKSGMTERSTRSSGRENVTVLKLRWLRLHMSRLRNKNSHLYKSAMGTPVVYTILYTAYVALATDPSYVINGSSGSKDGIVTAGPWFGRDEVVTGGRKSFLGLGQNLGLLFSDFPGTCGWKFEMKILGWLDCGRRRQWWWWWLPASTMGSANGVEEGVKFRRDKVGLSW
ncbi:hypothetical protein RHMOL_Rhmol07G0057200 [Rhododendron molle]|uniref:Uncharacterized protein n=1 Tax=Rhododendron molle TaxID=49168 RepID=A0ACC0MZF2_RHOML|nr:hypothetical protein RHMOL_Rhmol07G0057200 [Rhododendron molle]